MPINYFWRVIRLMLIGGSIAATSMLAMLVVSYPIVTYILGKNLSYEEWKMLAILGVGGGGVTGALLSTLSIKHLD